MCEKIKNHLKYKKALRMVIIFKACHHNLEQKTISIFNFEGGAWY